MQAEWKPESLDKFGEIAELTKSVDSLKIAETKPQGSTPVKYFNTKFKGV